MQSSEPPKVDVLIPARNQGQKLPTLLATLPHTLLRSVVVIDNGSSDETAAIARQAGAVVLREPRVGRGAACLAGIRHLADLPVAPDIVAFISADGSDEPGDLARLIAPISQGNAELVIGVRQENQRGSAPSKMVLSLIGAIYRHRFQDLGPLRAIRYPALVALSLTEASEAFDVEMLVKAVKLGLRIEEIPVRSRRPRDRSWQGLSSSAKVTGRSLFQILRHSTSR